MQPHHKCRDVTLNPLQNPVISTLAMRDYAVSELMRNEEMLNLR
jgi:hypothetical protein